MKGEELGMVGSRIEECVIMYGGVEWVVAHVIGHKHTRGNNLPPKESNEMRYHRTGQKLPARRKTRKARGGGGKLQVKKVKGKSQDR